MPPGYSCGAPAELAGGATGSTHGSSTSLGRPSSFAFAWPSGLRERLRTVVAPAFECPGRPAWPDLHGAFRTPGCLGSPWTPEWLGPPESPDLASTGPHERTLSLPGTSWSPLDLMESP